MLLRGAGFLLLCLLVQVMLCAEDYHRALSIDHHANDKQIKSGYRRLSKRFHRGKGPYASEAYEALIDPESRKIYDQYSHKGLKQRQQGGGGHYQRGQPRGHNIEIKFSLALRDFYNDRETEFQWEKQQIYQECDGIADTCHRCEGHGVRNVQQQLAPGMLQQVQTHCDACGERGKTIKHPGVSRQWGCPQAHHHQAQRGARGRQEHGGVVMNEADASPDYVAGDLIVTLVEKDPDMESENPDCVDDTLFRRKDLDERGEVVQPGHIETVQGERMPVWSEDGDSV
ncbi:hypothetical protein F4678DRAFT_476450 [Xylaria arbuscula]|nr:hypothetical protein F4678DRAFT_476450 [Xylaria arbuscula]